MDEGPLPQLGKALRFLILLGVRKDTGHQFHRHILRTEWSEHVLLFLLHNTPTQVNQHFWDVNLDRTYIIAGPTERGGIGERTGLVYTKQLWRQDSTDRS